MGEIVYATQDVYVEANASNNNFEGDALVLYGENARLYSFIDFGSLSQFAGKEITEAVIKIYIVQNELSSDTKLTFYRVTESWDAREVTYNSQPDISSTNSKRKTLEDEDRNWEQFNITELVQDIITQGGHGVRLEIEANQLVVLDSIEDGGHKAKLEITVKAPDTPPVVNSIDWSPKGAFLQVAAGATYNGQYGTPFRVIGLVGTEQVSATIGSNSPITYNRGDSFVLDDEGYEILHAIVDGECTAAVIAKDVSTNQHPTVGEEIQFVASVNWNDDGADTTSRRVEWFYLKPPTETYTKAYADNLNNWTLFATGDMPRHTFTDVGDFDIIYIKVIARNMANLTDEFGVGTCVNGLFNLWRSVDGFEITVVDGTGADNLHISSAELVPGTNTWIINPNIRIIRWDNVSDGVYFGVLDDVGCSYSDPLPDMCGGYPMVVGEKYAIYRATSPISVVGGEDIYTLQSGRTPVTVDRSYLNFLESSICGFFGLTGSACTVFVAELVDTVFVANYASIMLTGEDTFGNERELSWFDHVALPFALLGSAVPIPCAAVARKAGYAVAEISGKIFSTLVRNWTVTAVFDTPADAINMYGARIGFSKAIIDVGKETAEEIVRLLDLDDVDAAYTMLQEALNKFDPSDLTTYNSGFDWHEFNTMMKLKIDDPDIYLEYLRQAHILDGYGDYIKTVATKSNPTAAEKTAIAHALNEPEVMKVVRKDTEDALKTIDDVADQAAKEKRVIGLENMVNNLPEAFESTTDASIQEVCGYALKHDLIKKALGTSTCEVNREIVTRLFKKKFGVAIELTDTECAAITSAIKEDPVAVAKALDGYTDDIHEERVLRSLGKSGTQGEKTAAWLAAANKNVGLIDVNTRFGATTWDIVNDPSQLPMHWPTGVYGKEAKKAIRAADGMVPDFLTPELGYKFIQETAETVRLISTSDHLAELVAKAQAKDLRGIEDIFTSAGVDIVRSKSLADTIWDVSHRIDVLGDFIDQDDLMTLTERMVEANIVDGSKLFEQMVDRIVQNGTITTDELKSFFDIVNHNPVEVALAMEKIPAGGLASFNNVLNSMGNKGKAILTLMDMRNTVKTKLGDVGDTLLNGWVRTTPLGLRLGRTQGSGFGAGVFKSNSVHARLLEWAGDHWKALLLVLGMAGAAYGTAKFATYWFAFEWQPFHASLQRADIMDQSAEGKYTNAMYDIAHDMKNLDWDVDKLSTQESVYNNVGVLCELVKYADENPIPNDKLDLMKETFELYMGTSEGLVGNALYIDIQKDLRQLLMKYTEQYVECVDSGGCAAGAECITGVMVYEQRESSDDKLSDADEYQTIIDDAWLCTITPSGGTIICSSNVSGAMVWLDGIYKGTLFGAVPMALQNVSIGSHVVKIEGGVSYEPPYCEETIIIETEDDVKYFDCQMTRIGVCSDVTNIKAYIDPASPEVDELATFSGSATSYDPIEDSGYVWTFGDGTPDGVGQIVTHTYNRIGSYAVRLDVTNVCKKHGATFKSVSVKEPQDTGDIECTSNQMAFEVFLDGRSVGSSYGSKLKVISDVVIGTHSVKIQKGPGYSPESCTKTVVVTKDETSEVYCEMDLVVEATATLTIQEVVGTDGDPLPGAWAVEIWVENLYTQCKGAQTLVFGKGLKCNCEAPYNVSCDIGVNKITLKKAGYDDLSKIFELVPNDAKTWYSPTMVVSTSTPIHTLEMNMPNNSIILIDGEPAEETSVGRLISRIYAEGVPAKEQSVSELIAKLRRLGI